MQALEIKAKKRVVAKKHLYRWLKIILLVYCLVGIAIYYAQDFLILQPTTHTKDYVYQFSQPHKEVNIAVDATTNINIVQFTQPHAQSKGVVLYFHGNKGNIQRYARFVPRFTNNGYEVWMIDYPGYGKSTGAFSEDRVYDWSLVMYNLARKRFSTDSIIIYGKSLGTGMATQLASIRDSKYLILETPYYSFTSLVHTWFWMYPLSKMLHYKFPSNEYLKKVTAPVVIFHGTKDELIPYDNAIKLKEVLKKQDNFITIEGGTHRNLNLFLTMQTKLDALLQ
ncbi:MAG: alpha/beta hydrolase [Chitinophagaceae bacterium]|nr:alpha/beta hydrolase [Chitinophagaceae bacterium]